MERRNLCDLNGVNWTVNGGEAGNFVERIAGGGVIEFHLGRDDGMCLFYFLRLINL
jgi:hypothetical protein